MEDKSGNIPIGAVLKPQAIAAAGNATGAWADASKAPWFVALCAVGAGGGIGSAAFSIVQATDSTGTAAKAVTGPALTLATDGASGVMDVDPTTLDFKNAFTWIAVKAVMTGGTNSVATAVLVACDPHYAV